MRLQSRPFVLFHIYSSIAMQTLMQHEVQKWRIGLAVLDATPRFQRNCRFDYDCFARISALNYSSYFLCKGFVLNFGCILVVEDTSGRPAGARCKGHEEILINSQQQEQNELETDHALFELRARHVSVLNVGAGLEEEAQRRQAQKICETGPAICIRHGVGDAIPRTAHVHGRPRWRGRQF